MRDDEIYQLLGGHRIDKINSNVLYHYTSISSFKSIIENKELWITRSDFLNDPDELLYFAKLVVQTIEAIQVTGAIPEDFLNALKGNYISYFQNAFPQNYYILSLSKNSDSLSMWNYYGKNDGYCIGLNFKELSETITTNRFNSLHGSVIYNHDEQISILDLELQTAYEYWVQNDKANPSLIHSITDTLFVRWALYALFFKHEGYQNENEYRLVLTHRSDFNVMYRTAHGVFTPYVVLPTNRLDLEDKPVDVNEKFPLESVTISPYIKHDRAVRGLSEWLKKNNHTLDQPNQIILPSSISIRH